MSAPSFIAQGPGLSLGLPALLYQQATDDYLTLSPTETFTAGFTFVAFVKPVKFDITAVNPTENPPMTLFGDTLVSTTVQFGINGDNLELHIKTSLGWETVRTPTWVSKPSIYDGEWHTLGVTIDSSTMAVTFYIDDQSFTPGTGFGLLGTWANVTLTAHGAGKTGTDDTYDGYEAEWMTFNGAKTPAQMLDIHEYLVRLWINSAPPRLITSTPANGSSNNANNADISFNFKAPDVTNPSFGEPCGILIDETTEKVWIDGVLAYDAGSGFQVGYSGTEITEADGSRSFTITTRPASVKKTCAITVYAKDVAGRAGYFSFSFYVALDDVSDLVAKTWCEGKRIDLTWTNPAGVTHVKIRRSSQGYPRFTDDPGEDIYSGVVINAFVDGVYSGPLNTTNKALNENKFYYYTIFISYNGTTWLHSLSAECQGLSIKDYNTQDGDYVYNLLPREIRRADADPARGAQQYKQRDYCSVLQCGVNIYRGLLEATLHLRDPDEMPAGRLGDTQNNYGVLATQLWDYGLPAGRQIDAATMRRLAFSLIGLYKEKGICQCLVDLAKVVCTWDARCDEMVEALCGVNHLAYTWDNESFINQFISNQLSNNPDISVPGQVTFLATRFFNALGTATSGELAVAPAANFIIDALGTFACIASVGAMDGSFQQVVTFTDPTAKLRKEIVGSGTGGTSFTINAIDPGYYPWQYPAPAAEPIFGDNAFAGLKIMDGTGVIRNIISSSATDSLGNTVLQTSGVVMGGTFSIAADFDPAGATYAGRIPLLRAKIYSGEFTLTYHPLWDIRLKDEIEVGPWSLITSSSSTLGIGWSPTPVDVSVIVQNVHEDLGKATLVSGSLLQDSTKTWTNNEWTGYYLLPDWNQTKIFRIAGNTATELSADIPPGAGDLDTLAQANSHYVILSEKNAIRYSILTSILPSFVPAEIRPFVKFETFP